MIKQFLLILILLCGNVYSKDIYIHRNGNDNNSGSISSPLKNLLTAVRRAAPGDTIFVRDHVEPHIVGEVYIDRRKGMGGKEGRYLTIKAYADEKPVFHGVSRRFIIWADFVRLEGLTFRMPWYLDIFGAGNQVVDCVFYGAQPKFGAILAGGNFCLFQGNTITLNAAGNTRDHGIYLKSGRGNIIRGNTISGSQGYGIHIYEDGSNGNLIKDLTIVDNNVSNSRTRSGLILATANAAKIDGVVIDNNVFQNNKDFGVLIRKGNNITITNNNFIRNKLQINTGVTNVVQSGNTFNGEPPSSEPPSSEPPSSEPPNPNPGNGDIPPVPAEGDTIVIEGFKLEKIILIKKKE